MWKWVNSVKEAVFGRGPDEEERQAALAEEAARRRRAAAAAARQQRDPLLVQLSAEEAAVQRARARTESWAMAGSSQTMLVDSDGDEAHEFFEALPEGGFAQVTRGLRLRSGL